MEKEKELEINEAETKTEEVVEEAATEKVEESASVETTEDVKDESEVAVEATPVEENKEEPKAENGKEPIIQLKNVDITFGKFKAVKNATFDIYKGETFSLVGESGSGKTTIGRAIIRINPISNGEILFNGKRISGKISRKEDRDVIRNIQMIFQDPAASLNERATVEYIVSEGLYNFHLF